MDDTLNANDDSKQDFRIHLTNAAIEKIKDLLLEENVPDLKIRAFIQGGGCAGFSYSFKFDKPEEDDFIFDDVVIVDSMSMQYLVGATLDYKEEIFGSQFVMHNPNASTHCGCGSSFSV